MMVLNGRGTSFGRDVEEMELIEYRFGGHISGVNGLRRCVWTLH